MDRLMRLRCGECALEFIVADRDSRTQAVVDILDECRQAGARDLSLATRRESVSLPSP